MFKTFISDQKMPHTDIPDKHHKGKSNLRKFIQAGANRVALTSVPVRTNPETRESRLFKSMWKYIQRSITVIIRSFMMYRPLLFFFATGSVFSIIGAIFIIRFLIFVAHGQSGGHVQSLVLATMLIMVGVQCLLAGLQADVIAANRKILEDVRYRLRKIELRETASQLSGAEKK